MAGASLGVALRQIHQLMEDGAIGGLTDRQLLERFLDRRDERAFEAIVDRHGAMVMAVCRRSIDDPGDVDDAFQATFLVLSQRASTVRETSTLAPWLFVIARRACMMANRSSSRRRRIEQQAAEQRPSEGGLDATSGELSRVICEEVARLPDAYRLPIVLCLLEGRSRAEAAEALQWTESTVRGRLARARRKLRGRLIRRGLAPGTALTSLAVEARASMSLSRPLIEQTARLAHGSLTWKSPTAAVALARKILETSTMISTLKIAAFAWLAVGVVAGLAATQPWATARPKAPATLPQAVIDEPKPAAPPLANDNITEVRGRVLDLEGRAVANARLYLAYYRGDEAPPLEPRAVSGPDGSYRFTVDRSKITNPDSREGWVSAQVMATAPGYAPDWAVADLATKGDLTFKLPRPGPDYQGRVLDLEGRPVPGARVKVAGLYASPVENLTPVFELWKSDPRKGKQLASRQLGLIGVGFDQGATTDLDGRFRLEGVGPERFVAVTFEGPTIAKTWATLIPRDPKLAKQLAGLTYQEQSGKRVPYNTVYGTTFDHLAAPSRPIIGVVREQGTGKPVAGAYLTHSGVNGIVGGLASARSDAEGRYRLEGLGKASVYQLNAGERHHFMESKEVRDSAGVGPIEVDFEMRRGISIHGRLTEKGTGKPLAGSLQYFLTLDNPNPTEEAQGVYGFQEDGQFSVVVPPGRSLLCLRAANDDYVNAHTADSQGNKRFTLKTKPEGCHPSWFHAIVPIDLKDDAENVEVNVELDPGVSVSGKVEGPDGQPLTGVMLLGLDKTLDVEDPLTTAEFHAQGIDPKRGRVLIFEHTSKKIAKAVTVKGDPSESPMTVRLQPPGAINGRMVDDTGQPRPGLVLFLNQSYRQSHIPIGQYSRLLGDHREAKTDRDGRFRIEGLIDGLEYDVEVRNEKFQFLGVAAVDVSAPPDGSRNLGNLTIKPTKTPRE